MQPSSPQLPRDNPSRPASKNLRKGALWIVLALAVIIAALAFLLPRQQAKDTDKLPATPHRTAAPGYNHPATE